MKRLVIALAFCVGAAVPALSQALTSLAPVRVSQDTRKNTVKPKGEQKPGTAPSLAEMAMKPLMSQVIYPTSDAVFYVTSREPKNDADWAELVRKTETLAEASRVMILPTHRRDRDRWMKDAQLMIDASAAAVAAAKQKNLDALAELNDALYTSCVTCHKDYRPGYGKQPG
jgi:hypothetical protein